MDVNGRILGLGDYRDSRTTQRHPCHIILDKKIQENTKDKHLTRSKKEGTEGRSIIPKYATQEVPDI